MKLSLTAKRRIRKLITFMRSLPKSANKHFNMASFFSHTGAGHCHVAKGEAINRKAVMGCGTSACAAGWAATIPEFKRAGFIYEHGSGFSIAPAKFFDIDWKTDDALFYNFDVNTPKEWARHAELVLRRASRSS